MKLALVCFKYGIQFDDPCRYPLGFMIISSILKLLGHKVTVFNENLAPFENSDLVGFDAVLMTGFEEFKPRIVETAKYCRENKIKTILGGALATFAPDEMLKHVDVVVIGEGDRVVNDALHKWGKVFGIPPNLDSLPLPDYDGFGIDQYHRGSDYRYMGVLTSRGCPFSCKFCAHTCRYQTRDLMGVFDEIDTYRAKYGLDMVVFNDNTLNVSKSRFLSICAGMKNRGLKWSAAIRCDVFDEGMALAAKESGASYFVVGVESFKQDKLDAMNKQMTPYAIHKTLDLLHKYGIGYHGNILVGLPGETARDIIEEISALPKGYNIFPVFLQPFIGTTMKGEAKVTQDQRRKFSQHFKELVSIGNKYMYPEVANV